MLITQIQEGQYLPGGFFLVGVGRRRHRSDYQLTIFLEERRSSVSYCDRLPHTFLRHRYPPLTENISPEPRYLTPRFFAVEWDSGCTQLTIFHS
ncbi:hypothetical protein LC653_30930 [Nostoc sp. CHAB 5784]|uniref:hypothetical protein n=1 Tax=Nostoc mirabile TaxID=2907820 RepID=UPI001E36B586|nr:hypothetical protein [Nostoc mirabile]MCC5668170.1 hypothetical protein [Nostoc mirabile CHAB5784]